MTDDARATAGDRSPRYPAIGLPTAVEAIEKLWRAEKRTPVPPSVAVAALGYKGLSGAARTVLASLRQYGLVESSAGYVAVSPLAVDILVHDPATTEWMEAIGRAARSPDIFRELTQTHPDASDSAIYAYLITKKQFTPEGARKLVKAFRDTMSLANRLGQGYSQAPSTSDQAFGDNMITPQSQAPTGQQVTVLQFLLGGGIRAEVRFTGGVPEPSHIKTLEAHLKLTSDALLTKEG